MGQLFAPNFCYLLLHDLLDLPQLISSVIGRVAAHDYYLP